MQITIENNETFFEFLSKIHSRPRNGKGYSVFSREIIRKIQKEDKYFRKVKDNVFSKVIRRINELYSDKLFIEGTLTFPYNMGHLTIFYFKDFNPSKTKINFPKTLRYWYENEQAMKDNITVKLMNSECFKIMYNSGGNTFHNRQYYMFAVSNTLKKKLHSRIKRKDFVYYEP